MSSFVKRWVISVVVVKCALLSVFALTAYARADTEATQPKITTCKASWYGEKFHGRLMATPKGERFNMHDPEIVAHKSLPFGTKLRVKNPKNQKTIEVVVKDRGPYIHGRCLDLSKAGAEKLGILQTGVGTVTFHVIK